MADTALSHSTAKENRVLAAWGSKAVVVQLILLFAASFLLLPAAAHATGLPVRSLLPMHWPVLFAGLCYGWRSGALIGLTAPFLSYLISGMPLPAILPSMTVELAAYGFLAGLFREVFKFGWVLSTAVSLIGGRLVFLGFVLATSAVPQPFGEYLRVAMLPGLIPAIAQLILLPLAASCWVRREQRS